MDATTTELLASGNFDGTEYCLRGNVHHNGDDIFCTLRIKEGDFEFRGVFFHPEGMLRTFRKMVSGEFYTGGQFEGLDAWTKDRLTYVAWVAYRQTVEAGHRTGWDRAA